MNPILHSAEMEDPKTLVSTNVGDSQSGANAVASPPKQYLPASAPVSSLLPPIPTNPFPTVQSQVLALLSAGIPTSSQASLPLSPARTSALTIPTGSDPAATLLAAGAPPIVSGGLSFSSPSMQHWSLEQLEKHVKLLDQLKQTVPQNVSLLLSEARKREAKKHAKRVANKKSASSSRARKKALVQKMTELNSKLKRQARILALLPDLVIVVDTEGIITFCSAQVERVLRHKIDDLVGARLRDILVPNCRGRLENLMNELLGSESNAGTGTASDENALTGVERPREDDTLEAQLSKLPRDMEMANIGSLSDAAAGGATDTALVSEPSFPLSVVKVDAANATEGSDENENSDLSASNGGSKQLSSLSPNTSLSRSPTASSLGNSGSDDGAQKDGKRAAVKKSSQPNSQKEVPSSDSSNTSSLSTDDKKLQKANANLERNVRWHNEKLKDAAKLRAGYKDDVLGADVTANNATARLSSLQHRMDPNNTSARLSSLRHRMESSSEEDSGYRESNDSPEETSSSSSDLSESNARRKPLAPTCNICLIRDDLTTVWCEVTSSIRNPDREGESNSDEDLKTKVVSLGKSSGRSDAGDTQSEFSAAGGNSSSKEILLCLRPIRDGEELVDEKLRFVPNIKAAREKVVSEGTSSGEASEKDSEEVLDSSARPCKKQRLEGPVDNEAVKSLVYMSNKKG